MLVKWLFAKNVLIWFRKVGYYQRMSGEDLEFRWVSDGNIIASISMMTHSFILYFRPESYILLFRRPIGTDGTTGRVDPQKALLGREKFRKEYGLE